MAGKVSVGSAPVSRFKENDGELTATSWRHCSSKSIKYVVSVACQQEVSRDRDPKSVVTDKRDRDKYADNREHRENQGN